MASIGVVGDYKKSGLTSKELQNIVKAVFDVLGRQKNINIAFVDAEEIRVQNLEYRKMDKPTDVLSFDYEDEGDILLCIDKIDEYKDEDSLRDSVTKTLIHGALHLFGYDHENDKDHAIMDEISNKVFRRLS